MKNKKKRWIQPKLKEIKMLNESGMFVQALCAKVDLGSCWDPDPQWTSICFS